jgi:hypothetical protein
MRLVTRQDRVNQILDAWLENNEAPHLDGSVARKLAALPSPADPDEVGKIINNPSLTHIAACDVCSACGYNSAVQIDLQTEFDGLTVSAIICPACAKEIGELAKAGE